MWFSLFLLVFYTLLFGGIIFAIVKLYKKLSCKYKIVPRNTQDSLDNSKMNSSDPD